MKVFRIIYLTVSGASGIMEVDYDEIDHAITRLGWFSIVTIEKISKT